MKLHKLVTFAMLGFIALCSVATIAYARQERSQAAKEDFKYSHPCPANGNNYGPCPGFVIDHITPLVCNGADAPSNMQWQSVAEGKAKDKWERKGCQIGSSGKHSYSGNSIGYSSGEYHTGPKGGCYSYTASGNKRYVDHAFCGH